jgi:hypothetical protein
MINISGLFETSKCFNHLTLKSSIVENVKMSRVQLESIDFAIEQLLGQRGFSLVYRGTFRSCDVANKKVHVARLKLQTAGQEYKNIWMLDHPNGIKLLRVVDKEGFSRFSHS